MNLDIVKAVGDQKSYYNVMSDKTPQISSSDTSFGAEILRVFELKYLSDAIALHANPSSVKQRK